MNTRYLLDELSTKCIRDQCFDGLVHPKSGLPMQKGTTIQTNDLSFAREFAQRCTGHDYAHVPISGGNIAANTAFYPNKFCQRAVQLWKIGEAATSKRVLKKFQEAIETEEVESHNCEGCNSLNSIPHCPHCDPDSTVTTEEAMPTVHGLMRDILDDDEGPIEKTTEQKLMRVHRNLGHPSNRLLVQILKEAKAPASVIEVASKLECPFMWSLCTDIPSTSCEPVPFTRTRTHYGDGL